jgi:hypothetical protein
MSDKEWPEKQVYWNSVRLFGVTNFSELLGILSWFIFGHAHDGISGILKRKIVVLIIFFKVQIFFILIAFHTYDMPKCLPREIRFLPTFMHMLTCLLGHMQYTRFRPLIFHSTPSGFLIFKLPCKWIRFIVHVLMRVSPAMRKYKY